LLDDGKTTDSSNPTEPLLPSSASALEHWEQSSRSHSKKDNHTVQGQAVDLKFNAPKAAKYSLQLYIMSDSWIGCDVAAPASFTVTQMTKAEREGRSFRGKATENGAESESEGEQDAEHAEGEEEEEEYDYDSEETGTEESGAEEDDTADEPESAASAL
jgi:translocation protein SEC63